MSRKKILQSKNCYLTKLMQEDLPFLKKWRNEQMEILRQTRELTDEDQKNWYAKLQEDDSQVVFAILNNSDKLIGYCALMYIDQINKRGEIAFVLETGIDTDLYHKIFEEALGMLKDYGFEKLELHKIYTETYAFRHRHIKTLEKFGLTRTGILKDHIVEKGEFVDSILHSIEQPKKENILKGKQVLVTGGAGVIGKELIKLLQKEGAIVRCVDIAEKPKELDGVDYWRLDLSDPNVQCLVQFDPEYVFHLAADFERSTECLEFWDTNFKNNILASHNLLKEVLRRPNFKKIVFASSYLIYNQNLYKNTNQNNLLNERDAVDGRNLTAISKLQTEKDIEFFHEQLHGSFDYASARIFRVFGRGSRDVISRWVRMSLHGEELKVFSKTNSFDYIHARDVAGGLLALAKKPETKGIYNLSSGKAHQVQEVVKTIKKLLPQTKSQEIDDEIFPEASCGDVSKIKKTTGWSARFSLEDGIKDVIEYEKKKLK